MSSAEDFFNSTAGVVVIAVSAAACFTGFAFYLRQQPSPCEDSNSPQSQHEREKRRHEIEETKDKPARDIELSQDRTSDGVEETPSSVQFLPQTPNYAMSPPPAPSQQRRSFFDRSPLSPMKWRRQRGSSTSVRAMLGVAELQGRRPSMEDKTIFVPHLRIDSLPHSTQQWIAVYDGHNGAEASQYLFENLHLRVARSLSAKLSLTQQPEDEEQGTAPSSTTGTTADDESESYPPSMVCEALTEAFESTDESFLSSMPDDMEAGSTATTVLVLGQSVYCANVGDSRSLLCRAGAPVPLSRDHKPSREDELARIVAAGGFVFSGRVMGQLAVSRSFGDRQYKQSISDLFDGELSEERRLSDTNYTDPILTAAPEIEHVPLSPGEDEFLLLACDGLFDVMSNEQVCAFVLGELKRHGDPNKAASAIAEHAIQSLGSRDNVSVVIYAFKTKY